MTYEETIGALLIIATFFPESFSIADKAMVKVWHSELEPYPQPLVEKAVREMCRELPSFPTLKAILDRLGPPAIDASDAWRFVCNYVSEWGHGTRYVTGQVLEPPGIADPAIAAAYQRIGKEAIQMRTVENEGVVRAHFIRAYDEVRAKVRRDHQGQLTAGPKVVGPVQLRDMTAGIGREIPQNDP